MILKARYNIMEKKEEEIFEIRKICFLPRDQEYLIKLISGTTYNQLLEACGQWNILVTGNRSNLKILENRQKAIFSMLENENFKIIIEIHNKIKTAEGEGGQGVIPLLIDMIRHLQFDFLIPHMFLTGKVLDGYHNVHFSCLGSPGDIMNVIESSEHKLGQQ